MTTLERKADEIARTIGRRFLNLTVPARNELAALIVTELEPLVIEQGRLPLTYEDTAKRSEQALKIRDLLKQRRSAGATNVELVKIAMNHTARISELRRAPHFYRINCKRETGSIWRYTLAATDF